MSLYQEELARQGLVSGGEVKSDLPGSDDWALRRQQLQQQIECWEALQKKLGGTQQ